jgi:CheY-like chemotaxis protein
LPASETVMDIERRGSMTAIRDTDLAPVLTFAQRSDAVAEKNETPQILVVEDEPTVANLIADVLRDERMVVDVLPDGRSALVAAQRKSYDLAICDLRMPGMDGQIFYQTLMQWQNPLRDHVLFVTGDVLAQRTQEFLERYRLPHVAKPFRVEELTLAVHRMLRGGLQAVAW